VGAQHKEVSHDLEDVGFFMGGGGPGGDASAASVAKDFDRGSHVLALK